MNATHLIGLILIFTIVFSYLLGYLSERYFFHKDITTETSPIFDFFVLLIIVVSIGITFLFLPETKKR